MPGRTSATTVSAVRPSRRTSRQTYSPARVGRSARCAPTAWGYTLIPRSFTIASARPSNPVMRRKRMPESGSGGSIRVMSRVSKRMTGYTVSLNRTVAQSAPGSPAGAARPESDSGSSSSTKCASSKTCRPSRDGPSAAMHPVSATPYQSNTAAPPHASESAARLSAPRCPETSRTEGSLPSPRATSARCRR